MTFLNDINQAYGGAIAISGWLIGILSLATALYFYFNPRRPKYKILYKVFDPNWSLRRVALRLKNAVLGEENLSSSTYFIDVWNNGQETISHEILRGEFLIALQQDGSNDMSTIVKAFIDRETHAGISKFEVEARDGSAKVSWGHFDPGMGVRIGLQLDRLVAASAISLSGQGLGLDVSVARSFWERGAWIAGLRIVLVGALPILLLGVFSSVAIRWFTSFDFSPLIAGLIGLPAVLGGMLLLGIPMWVGAGVNSVFDAVFNLRSPIEREVGAPSVDRDLARLVTEAYLKELDPEEMERLVLDHQMRDERRALSNFSHPTDGAG